MRDFQTDELREVDLFILVLKFDFGDNEAGKRPLEFVNLPEVIVRPTPEVSNFHQHGERHVVEVPTNEVNRDLKFLLWGDRTLARPFQGERAALPLLSKSNGPILPGTNPVHHAHVHAFCKQPTVGEQGASSRLDLEAPVGQVDLHHRDHALVAVQPRAWTPTVDEEAALDFNAVHDGCSWRAAIVVTMPFVNQHTMGFKNTRHELQA
jgi:hypothetical protein